jgi:hypothetical protein
MARVNFAVNGLPERGPDGAGAVDEILRTLAEHELGEARFDPRTRTFAVEIDPDVHSFSDVRRTVSALGRRKGLIYLAIVMSP